MTQGAVAGLSAGPDRLWHRFASVLTRVKQADAAEWEPLSVFLGAGVVPRSSRADNHNELGADMSKYLRVLPGDLVFNKLRTWQGGFGASRFQGVVSPAYFVCRPRTDKVLPRYLDHLLHSEPYLAELRRLSKWMPPSQFDIPWEALKALPLLLPPLDVQRAIADFLDDQVARIDEAIRLRLEQAGALTERFSVLCQVETEGSAGSHVQMRRVLASIKTGSTPSDEGHADGNLPWYSPASFDSLGTLRSPVRQFSASDEFPGLVRFEPDSVIVVGIGATAGRVAHLSHSASGNQQLTALKTGPLMTARFLRWHLHGSASRLLELAPYTTLPILNNDFLKSVPVPLLSLTQQANVVEKLETAHAEMREILKITRDQVGLLKERKSSLVTAAVTGQWDVSTASGRDVVAV